MTTLHNSNTHNAISLNRLTPNVTPVMLLLGWEEYRQHWLHTGVLLGEVGDRDQGPAQSGEVEGN